MSLLRKLEHRVLHLKLNRPEKRNALNVEICSGIVDAVAAAANDPTVGCILLSGSGDAFSAGMDLLEAQHIPSDRLADIHERLFSIGAVSRKPIVVYVNGFALGGGLGLAVQGMTIVAAVTAVFGLTEIHVGLWPFLVYQPIETALGARRTLELSLTGRKFSAREAHAWGLVDHTGDEQAAVAIATSIANASPAAIAAGLENLTARRGKRPEDAVQLAKQLRSRLTESDDFKEGSAAFREKRAPRWPGIPQP